MSENSVENSMNEYYRLKNRYDDENGKNKKKIINNKQLSIKEKRAEFKQLKPKCVNCGKPGGTTFASVVGKVENSSETFRELRAFCKAVEPCGLNINIAVGNFNNINNLLKTIDDEIDKSKKEIIKDKNKLLFGLITTEQVLENFDIHKENITEFTELLENYLQEYIKVTDNAETKQKLKEELEKSYLLIQEIKHTISNFNTTNDIQFVRDAVNIYTTNLKPILAELLKLKYKQNMVSYNENTNTYHLIQNKYSIKDLEFNLGKYETVVFDTSLQTGPKKRALVIESSSSSTKNSRSLDTELNSSEAISEASSDDIIGKPTFNKDSNGKVLTVTWSNKEYQGLWNRMNKKLQDALLSDIEWLQEFMNNCVKARLEKKPCQFTNPSNLIIPPQISNESFDELPETPSQTLYDFGNTVYNDFFNKLAKGYQDTLLSLFTVKDGNKNYDMFEHQIASLIAKSLDFERGYI